MPTRAITIDDTPACPACGHQYLARGCVAGDGILWCQKCDSLFPESEFCNGTKSPETHKEKTDRARQPSRWKGRYSIRGSIWTPEGRCIDFETDLAEGRGETFLEMIGAQFKEGGSGLESVQIPDTLDEAVEALEDKFAADYFVEFTRSTRGLSHIDQEKKFLALNHHGFGQWIRNNWGLWSGSLLRDSLAELGLTHADDMSSVILTSFLRRKFDRPLDVEGQVKYYQEFWREQWEWLSDAENGEIRCLTTTRHSGE